MFAVIVQVDAEDSFKVLEKLSGLKDVEGVTVGEIRVVQKAQSQITGSRVGGDPVETQITKGQTTTQRHPTPAG